MSCARAITALSLVTAAAACAGDAPLDYNAQPRASRTWRTLDGAYAVDLPMDLLVQPQRRGVLATSSDGGFRFYLGLQDQPLPEQLGVMKDELIGLGFEVESEQHFESAVRIDLARGKKPNRLWRSIWIIDQTQGAPGSGPGQGAYVVVCEGLAREAHRGRLGDPLRAMCQGARPDRGP